MAVSFYYGARRVRFARDDARALYNAWADLAQTTQGAVPKWLRSRLDHGGPYDLWFDGVQTDLDDEERRALFEWHSALIRNVATEWAEHESDRETSILYLAKLIELAEFIATDLPQIDAPTAWNVARLTDRDRAECEVRRILMRVSTMLNGPPPPRLPVLREAIAILEAHTSGPNELLADLYYFESGALLDADDLEAAAVAAERSIERAESVGRRTAAQEMAEGLRDLF